MRWYLALGLMLTAAVDAGADPAEVRERAQALLASPGFQTELPGAGGGRAGADGGNGQSRRSARGDLRDPETVRKGQLEHRSPERRRGWRPPLLPGGEVLSAFLWVVLAVTAIIAISSAASEWQRVRRRQVATSDDGSVDRPAARRNISGLEDVEALAREGHYTEAVHLLLQLALARFERRLRLDRSLTSREILGRPGLGLDRESLSLLVETVERSWFGGAVVDRDAYERCLAASRRLAAGGEPATAGAAAGGEA